MKHLRSVGRKREGGREGGREEGKVVENREGRRGRGNLHLSPTWPEIARKWAGYHSTPSKKIDVEEAKCTKSEEIYIEKSKTTFVLLH